jgi:Mannosylglycerate hydrolase MGH1-like glycoside hydrolase domain
MEKLPRFKKRMEWFLKYREDLKPAITYCEPCSHFCHRMLAAPTHDRLVRTLRYMLDENEFLSPYGLRSVSSIAKSITCSSRGTRNIVLIMCRARVQSYLFGGNSNWRGPIWFPINDLIVEALERYHHFYGNKLKVECPVGSKRMLTLQEVAQELSRRLSSIFLPDENGQRPCHGDIAKYSSDPHWRDLVLFHEYFHGETGRGLGASHQTGSAALAARMLENAVENPARIESTPGGNGGGVPDIRRAAGAKFGGVVDRSAVPVSSL